MKSSTHPIVTVQRFTTFDIVSIKYTNVKYFQQLFIGKFVVIRHNATISSYNKSKRIRMCFYEIQASLFLSSQKIIFCRGMQNNWRQVRDCNSKYCSDVKIYYNWSYNCWTGICKKWFSKAKRSRLEFEQ